jgi:hypothetical protein
MEGIVNTTAINETWSRVVLLPAGTTYTECYVAVSGRPDRGVVLGMNQQYSLFYELCDLAALCEGGDLLLDGKVIKPERYLREWRTLFKDAKPITDSSNADLIIDAKLVVSPSSFEGDDGRWKRESLERLKSEHPYTESGALLEFAFDLANPLQSKALYDFKWLHFDENASPVTVACREHGKQQVSQPSLWELLA